MRLFYHLGRYSIFLRRVFAKPEKHSIFFRQVLKEIDSLGINSLGIVLIITVFMGAVVTLQTAYNIESPLIPRSTVGLAARDSILLEFSSTIVCLILAGKVGSSIASEIGTMRVTEQIDALEIMGVNSIGYLVLPKIVGFLLIIPFLVIIGMGIGVLGGWFAVTFTGVVPTEDYIYGIQFSFKPFYIVYSLIKSVVFSFIISSVSSYFGYYTKGGSLEVGKASTIAVVSSSIIILLFNLLLTQLLLV